MAKIIGRGAPTDKTYGILGQEYIDKLTGKRYICIKSATVTSDKAGEADHHCEWVEESAGGGASSWNDLTDKPFGEETPEPITWDGTIGDREVISTPEGVFIVKVSDTPLTKESIIGSEITLVSSVLPVAALPESDGSVYTITEDDIVPVADGVITLNCPSMPYVFIVEYDGAKAGMATLNRGIYFVSFNGEYCSKLAFAPQVKKLDDQYLPPVTKFYHIIGNSYLCMTPNLSEGSLAHSRDIDNALTRGPIVIYEVSSSNPDYIKRIMYATTIEPGEEGYAIHVTMPGGNDNTFYTDDYAEAEE